MNNRPIPARAPLERFELKRFEAFERAFLIRPHQPRTPRHISGDDRGETAGLADVASPGRLAQARQVQLAVLQVPVSRAGLQYTEVKRAHALDDLSRFVKPSHMRIAGSEKAVRHYVIRAPFQ